MLEALETAFDHIAASVGDAVERGRAATGLATASLVTVPSGSTAISVPIPVTGNTTPGDGRSYLVAVKAVRGVSAGDVYGQLTVQDDDA